MRKSLLVGAAGLVFAAAVHSSGIPVLDGAALTQALQSYMQLQQQYQMLTSQYNQLQQTYGALTGDRGMSSLLWNPTIRSLMPTDMSVMINQIQNLGPSALTGTARTWYDQNNLGRSCQGLRTAAQDPCYKEQAYYAYMHSQYAEGAQRVEQRSKNIESLMKKISTAQDPKAIQDLSVRVQAENASLNAESLRLKALSQVQEAQRHAIEEQRQQALMEWMDNSNMTPGHIKSLNRSIW